MLNEFQVYNSVPFNEFYKKLNGFELKLDFINRKVEIYDISNIIVATLQFSSQIQTKFGEVDLMNIENKDRTKVYYVYTNGIKGYNWLWYYEVNSISKMFEL